MFGFSIPSVRSTVLLLVCALISLSAVSTESLTPTFNCSDIVDGSIPYVSELSNLSSILVSSICTADSCSNWNPSGDILQQALLAVDALQAGGSEEDPCAKEETGTYNQDLHIAAIFIILFASVAGCLFPIYLKAYPSVAIHPFVMVMGKCMGTGIILACGLIHMLLPAAEALSSPCLSKAFTEEYTAYAYLFAMLAILMMQLLDFVVTAAYSSFRSSACDKHAHKSAADTEQPREQSKVVVVHPVPEGSDGAAASSPLQGDATPTQYGTTDKLAASPSSLDTCVIMECRDPAICPVQLDNIMKKPVETSVISHDDDHHHIHSILFAEGVEKTIAAYVLEFGITVHSVLIGITNGIVGEQELKTLLVALCFHQFFEGVSLGARIVDANFSRRAEAIWMILVFSISAPVGIGIGIGVVNHFNPNGASYNYAAGTLDGICGGILIYLGLMLLLQDFQEDSKKYKSVSKWCAPLMFVSLWIGAGFMAFIGKYL